MKKTKVTFNLGKLETSQAVLRALAHPLRLKILKCIDDHEVTHVNQIYKKLDMEQSICSQHLRIMRNAGVLLCVKSGQFVYYSIDYNLVSRTVEAINRFNRH